MFKKVLFAMLLVVPMCSNSFFGLFGTKQEIKKEEPIREKDILLQLADFDANIFKKRFARCEERKQGDILGCYEKEHSDLQSYLAEAEPFAKRILDRSVGDMRHQYETNVVGVYLCSLLIVNYDVQKRMEELRKAVAK